jgi:putative transposase
LRCSDLNHEEGSAGGAKTSKARRGKRFVLSPPAAARDAGQHVDMILARTLCRVPRSARVQLRQAALRASCWRGTLSGARRDLAEGLSGRSLRRHLEDLDLAGIEAAVNDALWHQARPRLPARCIVAADLTLIPYHGRPHRDEGELRRCKALQGTTWFHAFGTLNVTMHGRRYTVAATFATKGDSTATVLERLLENAMRRGLRIQHLLADKGFCTRDCLNVLRRRGLSFVIPLALRGHAARALQAGRRSYATTHTIAGEHVQVAVVIKRNREKYHRRKPGNHYFPYIYEGVPSDPKIVDRLYRRRGGIETSYRLMNQARARTTTRRPATRFLLFAISLLVQNAWITATWRLSRPCRGRQGRKHPPGFFPFKTFLQLLCAHIERVRHRLLEVVQLSGGD